MTPTPNKQKFQQTLKRYKEICREICGSNLYDFMADTIYRVEAKVDDTLDYADEIYRHRRDVLIVQMRHIVSKWDWYVEHKPTPERTQVLQLSLFDYDSD